MQRRQGGSFEPGPSPRLLTWEKLGQMCLGTGLVLMVTAAITKTDSVFIWIVASACIALAVVFFVVHLKTDAQRPRSIRGRDGARARGQQVIVTLLLVLLSIFSSKIRNGIEGIWLDAPATSGQVPAGAAPPSIVNNLVCPVLPPTPYACRNGSCPTGGRYSR